MKIVITVKDTDNVIGLKEDIAMRLEGVADIVRIDTADVVLKSEDCLPLDVHEALKQRAVEKAKSEFAGEIFEEIDNAIENLRGAFLRQRISELKKKYIGKEND